MFEADIHHHRPLHTSILGILSKCLRPLVSVSGPYACTRIPFHRPSWAPDLGILGHLRSLNDTIASWLMLISTTDLFIFHISILDIYKVFEPLVCCLNGMGAPVYQHSTGHVGPRSGNSGLLTER